MLLQGTFFPFQVLADGNTIQGRLSSKLQTKGLPLRKGFAYVAGTLPKVRHLMNSDGKGSMQPCQEIGLCVSLGN